LHFFLVKFLVRDFPVDDLGDVVADFFELGFFLLGESLLLDGHGVELLLFAFDFLFQGLDGFLLIQQ
jgi:hypothetical protein